MVTNEEFYKLIVRGLLIENYCNRSKETAHIIANVYIPDLSLSQSLFNPARLIKCKDSPRIKSLVVIVTNINQVVIPETADNKY